MKKIRTKRRLEVARSRGKTVARAMSPRLEMIGSFLKPMV
jgi:hypothetical protein